MVSNRLIVHAVMLETSSETTETLYFFLFKHATQKEILDQNIERKGGEEKRTAQEKMAPELSS